MRRTTGNITPCAFSQAMTLAAQDAITARFIRRWSADRQPVTRHTSAFTKRGSEVTRPRSIWLNAIVLVACLAGADCGRADSLGNSPVAPSPPVPSSNFIIDVAEINGPYSFYPSPATVRSEQVIVWRNSDTVTHHVVFDDMSVDTGTLAPGTLSQPITVRPGNWSYHCAIHPSMVGGMNVMASTSTAAGSTSSE
ncbi:MAG: hypothetical protein C5B57_03325 [Blastocatellia bacterium]|nr:MAG: hypothetical protein C5B57_03325 [Blastocatellia bacterium]